jgi:hypothetical protein
LIIFLNSSEKIFTYAKEQLDILKNGAVATASVIEEDSSDHTDEFEIIEVVETEEVTFTEIMPVTPPFRIKNRAFR